jgi:hypothetical protein
MGKVIKISPIRKEFTNSKFKTQEGAYAAHGYVRHPGTKSLLTPVMEADGRYRTGLDKNSPYVRSLPDKERDDELEWIKETTNELEEIYGKWDAQNRLGINLSPRSPIWNVYSDEPIKATAIPLANNDIFLNTDQAQDLLDWCWVKRHPRIARSLESYHRGDCPDCQYYIADDEAEARIQYKKNKLINKAIVDFEALTPTRAIQIARLMGLPVTDFSTQEAVYNLVDSKLKEADFKDGEFEGLPVITVFNSILALTSDELHVKDVVKQAMTMNIYRKGTGDKIVEGTEVIAVNRDALIKHLLDPQNQKELLALEIRVKQRGGGI